jgi:hypothetical protein
MPGGFKHPFNIMLMPRNVARIFFMVEMYPVIREVQDILR